MGIPSLAKRLTNMRLLVKNIGQLVTVVEGEEVCLAGKDMGQIKVREGGAKEPLAVAVDANGLIAMVGTQKQVRERFQDSDFAQVLDAKGCAVTPGLVDGHTHPVWAGDRVHEFAMKLAGASYMEVPYSIYAIYFFQSKQNFLT